MAEAKAAESKVADFETKDEKGEDSGEALCDRVRKFCMSQGFEREFEEFAARHCELFMSAVDRPKGSEHDLEFHEVYRDYLTTFEGQIEAFVLRAGGTIEQFSREAHEVLDNSPPEDLNRFFIEALLATTEYEIFLMLMVDEARKHRDEREKARTSSHK